MKYMQFYKLYDWILAEFGASSEAVIIAIIYSFQENGIECKLSYSQYADILKITRPRAIEKIRRLIEAGYISVITNSTKTNTYFVNRQAFNNDEFASAVNGTSASAENGTSEKQLVPETELALVPKTEPPSAENGTSASAENGTQIENIREIKKENGKRECDARARSVFSSIPEFPEIRLTEQDIDMLQYGIDYKQTGKTMQAYFAILADLINQGKQYNDHFTTLRKWILQDGGKLRTAGEAQKEKEYAEMWANEIAF